MAFVVCAVPGSLRHHTPVFTVSGCLWHHSLVCAVPGCLWHHTLLCAVPGCLWTLAVVGVISVYVVPDCSCMCNFTVIAKVSLSAVPDCGKGLTVLAMVTDPAFADRLQCRVYHCAVHCTAVAEQRIVSGTCPLFLSSFI